MDSGTRDTLAEKWLMDMRDVYARKHKKVNFVDEILHLADDHGKLSTVLSDVGCKGSVREKLGQLFDGGCGQPLAERVFTEEEVRRYWAGEKPLYLGDASYRVGRMSYGDYFLEPSEYLGGERDSFHPDTLWLERTKNGFKLERLE